MDESGTDGAKCSRKVVNGRRVAGPLLMIGICRLSMLVLRETVLVFFLTYGSKTMLWKEKERSRLGLYRWTTSEA